MTAFFSSTNFALQSSFPDDQLCVSCWLQGREVIAWVEADHYPHAGILQIDGLMPGRHYRLHGPAPIFCRADAAGHATLEITLGGPTPLLLSPVI
jgi:hypothetical protein